MADLMTICSCGLRELEISFARDIHLTLHGDEVQLMVPVHKTNSMGPLTVRSLQCAFGLRDHPLYPICPWHVTERHLIRLASHPHKRTDRRIPSFVPLVQRARCHQTCADQGDPQYLGVDATIRYDSAGREVEKFSGRCLRVPSAQFLAAAGVQVALIQLLGGWSSSASTEA